MIEFSLPYPPSVNELYKNVFFQAQGIRPGRGRAKTKKYLAWELEAALWIKRQRPKATKGQVSVEYNIKKPDRRKRDLGNLEKALSDCLVRNGLIEDDSLISEIRLHWADAALNKPCYVCIRKF